MKKRDYSRPLTPMQMRFLRFRILLLSLRAIALILFITLMVIIYGK
ncbi:MAG: hypothetical protein ACYDAO_06510 [Thermoplasmataceae archaeon]